ncbi:unnamed protein product, partial [Brassica oleracea]
MVVVVVVACRFVSSSMSGSGVVRFVWQGFVVVKSLFGLLSWSKWALRTSQPSLKGDVESVASKNSKELTGLLEQISGSGELKKEYEELEEKKARAEEKAALIYQKKKTIGAEKKLKKAQKEEAEKHLKLLDELKALKREHSLWQLCNIENDIEKASEDVDAEKSNRKDVMEKLEKFEHEARE